MKTLENLRDDIAKVKSGNLPVESIITDLQTQVYEKNDTSSSIIHEIVKLNNPQLVVAVKDAYGIESLTSLDQKQQSALDYISMYSCPSSRDAHIGLAQIISILQEHGVTCMQRNQFMLDTMIGEARLYQLDIEQEEVLE